MIKAKIETVSILDSLELDLEISGFNHNKKIYILVLLYTSIHLFYYYKYESLYAWVAKK